MGIAEVVRNEWFPITGVPAACERFCKEDKAYSFTEVKSLEDLGGAAWNYIRTGVIAVENVVVISSLVYGASKFF